MTDSALIQRWQASGLDAAALAAERHTVVMDSVVPAGASVQRWHLSPDCPVLTADPALEHWLGTWSSTIEALEASGAGCGVCAGLEAREAYFTVASISLTRWHQRAMLLASRTRMLSRLSHPAELAVEAWRLAHSAERFPIPGPVVDAALAGAAEAFARRDAALELDELLTHPLAECGRVGWTLVTARPRPPLTEEFAVTDRRSEHRAKAAAAELIMAWLGPAGVVRAVPAAAVPVLADAAAHVGWLLSTLPCPEPLTGIAGTVATSLLAQGMDPDRALPAALATVTEHA